MPGVRIFPVNTGIFYKGNPGAVLCSKGMIYNFQMPKFIFVTGGVVSSLGKGIATSSIGLLIKRHGYSVKPLKLDPYLNVDPGTMNPFQHGEVFVTDDGAETDLDLGHYERFLNQNLSRKNNATAGQIYESLIKKEREGHFLGKTVQVVPHLTDEIKLRITDLIEDENDVIIVEIGGTVGDIESLPFLEAIRQMRLEYGDENTLFIHVTLVPYIRSIGELKTKPTQHSVMKLREIGIQPDLIICRAERKIGNDVREKISLFTNVPKDMVVEMKDLPTIYQAPLILHREKVDVNILKKLNLTPSGDVNLSDWKDFVDTLLKLKDKIRIGIVGKYVDVKDSYKSISEAFVHASVSNKVKVELKYIDSEKLEEMDDVSDEFSDVDGILVPGGFGHRGIEGKIKAIKYARENRVPFFGICLGMQLASIEFARNVLGLKGANSTEFVPDTEYPIITILPEKKGIKQLGGTLRKGAYPAILKPGTLTYEIYGRVREISERHRHRYEFNPIFREEFEKNGMIVSGESPDGYLVEIIELKDHPFFIGVQFHPEFKSRPMSPHPIFHHFVKAAKNRRSGK